MFINKLLKIGKTVYVAFGVFIILFSIYTFDCLDTKVCGVDFINKLVRDEISLVTPNGTIDLEVVDTEKSRGLGLSGRTKLKDSEGMIFRFEILGKYSFWMRDMLFPIDILWVNEENMVIHIESNVNPKTYPHSFVSILPALSVIELNGGLAEWYDLHLGSTLIFQK